MKTIKNYSKYEIYPDGRVYTTRLRKGWMVASKDKNGYLRYPMVGDNKKRKGMYAHQLVALAFLPNPKSKPFVNHKDHDKSNNTLENLEWCTHLENIRHDWATGVRKAPPQGADNWNSKYPTSLILKIRQLYHDGHTQMDIKRLLGIPQPTISVIVRRKQWRNI